MAVFTGHSLEKTSHTKTQVPNSIIFYKWLSYCRGTLQMFHQLKSCQLFHNCMKISIWKGFQQQNDLCSPKIFLRIRSDIYWYCTTMIALSLELLKYLVFIYYLHQGGYVIVVVCLSVCLSVSNFAQKLLNRFAWNFQDGNGPTND